MAPQALEDAACSSLLQLKTTVSPASSPSFRAAAAEPAPLSPTSSLHAPVLGRGGSLGSEPSVGHAMNPKRRWRREMERQHERAAAAAPPSPALLRATALVSPEPPPSCPLSLQLARLAASMERTAELRARLLPPRQVAVAVTPASLSLQLRRLKAAMERTRQSRACVRLARRTAAARAQAEAAAVSFRLVAAMRRTRESRMRVVGCRYRASAARLAVAMRRTGESRRGVARQRELLRVRTCDVPAVPLHMLQSKLARVASQGNGAMHCQRSQTVATDGTHHSQVHKSI